MLMHLGVFEIGKNLQPARSKQFCDWQNHRQHQFVMALKAIGDLFGKTTLDQRPRVLEIEDLRNGHVCPHIIVGVPGAMCARAHDKNNSNHVMCKECFETCDGFCTVPGCCDAIDAIPVAYAEYGGGCPFLNRGGKHQDQFCSYRADKCTAHSRQALMEEVNAHKVQKRCLINDGKAVRLLAQHYRTVARMAVFISVVLLIINVLITTKYVNDVLLAPAVYYNMLPPSGNTMHTGLPELGASTYTVDLYGRRR